jgi:hypothetical protein
MILFHNQTQNLKFVKYVANELISGLSLSEGEDGISVAMELALKNIAKRFKKMTKFENVDQAADSIGDNLSIEILSLIRVVRVHLINISIKITKMHNNAISSKKLHRENTIKIDLYLASLVFNHGLRSIYDFQYFDVLLKIWEPKYWSH